MGKAIWEDCGRRERMRWGRRNMEGREGGGIFFLEQRDVDDDVG